MGLGNSAPPGSEATRKAEGLYADTLINYEINYPTICYPNSTRNIPASDEDLKKEKKAPAPFEAENYTFPKGEAPRKLHSHALKKFSFDFLQGKPSHEF